jgi:hypothetical protein
MHISPDARSAPAKHALTMATDAPMRNRRRPVTQLYDSACELLFAAQQLRAAAGERDSAPALAATIGCIDATLESLAQAIAAMKRTAVAELTAAGGDGHSVAAVVVERELAVVADAVGLAQAACDQARERSAPILAQLTLA